VTRVTLDVKVLVSGFSARSGTSAELVTRWLGREFELVVFEPMLSEAADA
jgi:hypothetical protein